MNSTLMQALNNQLTLERQNAAIYDALASALDVVFWDGSSAWMKKSANEEREHADKFAAYIVDRMGEPVYSSLDGCNCPTGDNLVDFFSAALAREQMTTEAIKTLYFMSEDAEDPQTCQFLHWFLEEQTKSEREISDYLILLKKLDKTGMYLFDKELK